MDGLFFLMSVLGVGVVMWWVLQNDDVAPDQPTKGLFAMLSGSQLVRRRRRLRSMLAAAAKATAQRKSPF
jgi:hypothetical protein